MNKRIETTVRGRVQGVSSQILYGTILLGLSGMLALAGCRPVQPAASHTPASVVTTGAGDSVVLSDHDDMLVANITSVRGIGRAQLALNPAALPAAILLRLHLQGLELLAVDNGKQRLEIAVASSPPYLITQSAIDSKGTQLLHDGSARWATVTILPDHGSTPTIPLQDGHFDVLLPIGLIDAEHSNLTLAWIDFYR